MNLGVETDFPKVRELLRSGVDCIESQLVVGDDERAKLKKDYQEALDELNKGMEVTWIWE